MLSQVLNIKKCFTILPRSRIIDTLYYLENFLNIEEIDFKFKNHNDHSNLVIIDQTLINKIKNIKNPSDYIYLIMIWNTDIDIDKYQAKFKEIKKKFEIKLYFFCIGTFYKRNKNYITINKLNLNKKKLKLINLDFINYIKFKFPKIYYSKFILRNPIKFFKRINNKKIIFFGFGKITDKNLSDYLNKNQGDFFEKEKKKIFYFLSKAKNENEIFDYFQKISITDNFGKLKIHEKYYFLQCIFRHLFITICQKFENFDWMKTDHEFQSYQSPFFKKNVYLDFGSKITNTKIYSRYLFLKKFQKKIIRINFFQEFRNSEILIKIQTSKSINFLKELQKLSLQSKFISAKDLARKINQFYNTLSDDT